MGRERRGRAGPPGGRASKGADQDEDEGWHRDDGQGPHLRQGRGHARRVGQGHLLAALRQADRADQHVDGRGQGLRPQRDHQECHRYRRHLWLRDLREELDGAAVHQLCQREAAGALHQDRLRRDHEGVQGGGHRRGRHHVQRQRQPHQDVRDAKDGPLRPPHRGVHPAKGHGRGLHREGDGAARKGRHHRAHEGRRPKGRLRHQPLCRPGQLRHPRLARQEQGPAQRRPRRADAVLRQRAAQGALHRAGGRGARGGRPEEVQVDQVQGRHRHLLGAAHGPRRHARQVRPALRALLQVQRPEEARPGRGRRHHAPAQHVWRARRAACRPHRIPRPHAL
mmetsp:Transcript_49202/g.155765  ORF Transcript_49202/g.155765 Transcript_49202/m.155765 type:complete len:338 (-) Transcript_49202:2318-3331(-)